MNNQINIITNKLNSSNDKLQKLIGKKEVLENSLKSNQEEEKRLLYLKEIVDKAKILLEVFVKSTETKIRDYIEPTITEALHFIFSQPLYFHIYFVSRRNQVEVDFTILPSHEKEKEYQNYLKNGEDDKLEELINSYKDIVFNFGGSIAEVLGLILQLLLAEFLKIEGVIALDEPTSAVHEIYASRVGAFIKSLSDRFNRQIVYVTHSQAMASAANKVYEVKKINELSVVEEV